MIPVPAYLAQHTEVIKTTRSWVRFSFSCPCGGQWFVPYQNAFSAEEKCAMQPYNDALEYLWTGRWGATCTIDEDGTLHHWKFLSPAILGGLKEEVFLPPKPFFAGIRVVKVRCEHCGAEYTVFDNRCHGYDGVTGEQTEQILQYQPQFRSLCRAPVRIEIKVENDPCLDAFNDNTGLEYDEARYSDAFGWIGIYGVNENGKCRKLFEEETA